jgi:cytochrome c biogenesis protein
MSTVEVKPQTPPELGPGNAIVAQGRRAWRWLTSMRTALILLFLLAVAAIPGSLLPQHNLNEDKVQQYYVAHPGLAPVLERIGAFNVFSSVWFSAIYLLLFTSLVGCLVPRFRGHLVALLRVPPDAPSRLDRLPAHADNLRLAPAHESPTRQGDPAAVAQWLRAGLRKRRWRTVVRPQPGGGFTVSAEKGYLKESGNVLFHFALLALLIGVAFGSMFGYRADRVVVQGDDQGFCNTLQQYDDYALGSRVAPGDLEPFCLMLNDFRVDYRDTGQPVDFAAAVTYTVGDAPGRQTVIDVNKPLRLARARVYLLGHGYAPVLRYTDRYGNSQTTVAPFMNVDSLGTGEGVLSYPDANVDPAKPRDPNDKQQVAFSGFYVPTSDGTSPFSVFPGERNPVLVVTPYRGDLGLDAGIPHSVYSLDQHEIDTGRLKPISDAPLRLRPGQSATLDDGTRVDFIGTVPWVALTVRYDPGEQIVLVGAVCLLLGLVTSLTGRRRRVWFRIPPDGPVEAGALARSEYAGFHDEFTGLLKEVALVKELE